MTRQAYETEPNEDKTHHEAAFQHTVSISWTGMTRYQEMYPGATKPEIAHAVEMADPLTLDEVDDLLDHLEADPNCEYRMHPERTGIAILQPHRVTGAPTLVTFVGFRSHRMRTRAVHLHGEGQPPTCCHTWPETPKPSRSPAGDRLLFGVPAHLVRPSTGLRSHLGERDIPGALLSVDWQPGPGPTPSSWLEKHHAETPWEETVQHGTLDDRPVVLLKRGGSLWASLTPTLHLQEKPPPHRAQQPLQPREVLEEVIPWLGVPATEVAIESDVTDLWGQLRYGQPPTNAHQKGRLRWEIRARLLHLPPPPKEGDAFRPRLGGETLWLTLRDHPARRWWLTSFPLYTPPTHEQAMADALIARGWHVRQPLRDPDDAS